MLSSTEKGVQSISTCAPVARVRGQKGRVVRKQLRGDKVTSVKNTGGDFSSPSGD